MTGLLLGMCADANYASKATDWRSVSGVVIMCGAAFVSWFSKTQKCVAQSTTKAELLILAKLCLNGLWWVCEFADCDCLCVLGFDLCHVDVQQAFVQSNLKYDVFMRMPKRCVSLSGIVVRLIKSLYGLKQASRSN